VAFQFFILYRSKCVRRVETVAILSLISLTQMEWEMLWGVVGGGGFYCFKRQNGVAGFFILTSLCVFAILNIFLITSSRTHTHTHVHRERQSRTYSVTHTQAHTYGNTNISSQFAAASRQRTANKIIRQNVCGALYALLFGSLGGSAVGGRAVEVGGGVYGCKESHTSSTYVYTYI